MPFLLFGSVSASAMERFMFLTAKTVHHFFYQFKESRERLSSSFGDTE